MTLDIKPLESWRPPMAGMFSGISNEHYHDPKGGMSRSMGWTLLTRSPAHLREEMDNPKPATKFMEFGSLVHCAVLEPEKLNESYWVRPDEYPADPKQRMQIAEGGFSVMEMRKWTLQSNWCKQWVSDHANRPIISLEEEGMVMACCDRLREHPSLAGMLRSGYVETSCFVVEPGNGTWIKCRPDLMAFDDSGLLWVFDIKKVQDASQGAFTRQARQRGMDFQVAWYLRVLELLGLDVSPRRFVFVGVEENPPHEVATYPIDANKVLERAADVQRAIDVYTQCQETGRWPGYPRMLQTITWRKYE